MNHAKTVDVTQTCSLVDDEEQAFLESQISTPSGGWHRISIAMSYTDGVDGALTRKLFR